MILECLIKYMAWSDPVCTVYMFSLCKNMHVGVILN